MQSADEPTIETVVQSLLEKMDLTAVISAGQARATVVARLEPLQRELARADAAIAAYHEAQEAHQAADAAAEEAVVAAFRKSNTKNEQRKEEAVARVATTKARLDGLRAQAKTAQAARPGIASDIEAAEKELAKQDRTLSATIANAAIRAAEQAEKLYVAEHRRAARYADIRDQLEYLAGQHGREIPDAGPRQPRPETDQQEKAYAVRALHAAINQAAGVPGGPKQHPYTEEEWYERRTERERERESERVYARFAARQDDWAHEAKRNREAAEAPMLRARVEKLESFIKARGYSGV